MKLRLRLLLISTALLIGYAQFIGLPDSSSLRSAGSGSAVENQDISLCQQRELDERHHKMVQNVSRRVQCKIFIVEELIDERLTLDEAAQQFLELNRMHPEIVADTRRRFPAESDEMSSAKQVLSFVQAELNDDPIRCQDVLNRLECDCCWTTENLFVVAVSP